MLRAERAEWVDQLDHLHLLTLLKVVLILLIAVIATWLARRVIKRTVASMHTLRSTIGPVDARAERRASTLTTVLRSAASAVIWTVAIITVLSELGVNVGALVAVSTIIGGALAFGAQQIVRDLLAGFFMFTEDQYGVGDIVDLGLATGTVEEVTLRVTRVRDVEGRVWYVPNGQIQRVANLSQEWAQAVLDVPVDPSMDVDEASAVIERTAATLRDDDQFGGDILDVPKVVGVQDVQDDRVVLRLVIRTRPAAQFAIVREMRARLLAAVRDGELVAPRPPTTAPPSS